MKRERFRLHAQVPFNFSELVIDSFAGGGGASSGIERALGRAVDIAINHDLDAIRMHEVNHPHTRHYCESVWDVDPRKVCAGNPVSLAWFSPDCKHFSKAKGRRPVEKRIRGLAWVVLRWAATVAPRVIMLENVEEFVTWGPLVKNAEGDSFPCPKNRGRTFNSFVNALRRQGYEVEWRDLRACDFGAPTIRRRLFLIARRDGQPIIWPQPTHGDPLSESVMSGRLLPWKTAADCIDWAIPCPSIFERTRPLAEATLRRIAKGIMRYVVGNPTPFVVGGYGQKLGGGLKKQATENRIALVAPVLTECANASSPRCMPASAPLRTICAATKGGHHALVATFLAKHYSGVVGTAVDVPAGTVTTVDHHSLVAAHLVRQFGHSVGSGVAEPVGTVMAGGGGKTMLATSHLVKLRGTCRDGQPVTEPLHTVSAQGLHFGEVRAFLTKYYGSNQNPRLNDPLHTVTTRDRFGLVLVRGEEYRIVDIGLRMLSPRELFRAQGFSDDYIIDRDARGNPVTKVAQVARCGNSVCPPMAEALVRANMVETVAVRGFARGGGNGC